MNSIQRPHVLGLVLFAACGAAQAEDFELFGVSGAVKNRLTVGAAWRAEPRDERLIGKLNINGQHGLCPENCLSLSGDPAPDLRYVRAKGAFAGSNIDNGDLNYAQGNLVAANSELASELSLSLGEFTFKADGIAFFDPSNFGKHDHHPDTQYQPAVTPRSKVIKYELGERVELGNLLVSGKFTLFDHDFTTTVGWQHIRWGESTLFALGSLSEINAPDERILYQPGAEIKDIFHSTPAILLGTPLVDNLSLDLVYLLGWSAAGVSPDGAFNSRLDLVDGSYVNLTLGQASEDPNQQHRLSIGLPGGILAPASLLTSTSLSGRVLPTKFGYPDGNGQFGAKLSYFASELNGGTELDFYFLNYHSRLPYLSTIASDESCIANANAATFPVYFAACKASGQDPLPIDTAKVFFDYPKNIQMFGLSFNTNLGKWSLAGEYSIRPNMPLQVHAGDIIFTTLQPAFPDHDITFGTGTLSSLIPGVPTLPSGFNLVIPGRRTILPDYLSIYRGQPTEANQIVRGYERRSVDQLDLTAIRALGASDNPVGADQVLFVGEFGMTHVWGMPDRSRLQFEGGDANATHASPGADGTGWPTGTPPSAYTHTINPTQQRHGFASSLSMGYRMIVRLEYDGLMFGWNYKPQFTFGQDVSGIAPMPAQNFIAGRKIFEIRNGIEINQQTTAEIFYLGSTGGGTVNTQRDRDVVGVNLGLSF